MIKGYKSLDKNLKNMYGFQYEIGKKYILNGELKWKENGFHFCTYMEDTLRYIKDFNTDFKIVEVIGSGDIVKYDDEYYGYYDMYASSVLEIIREIKREELINEIINSNVFRVKRLISSIKLTEEELFLIKEKYKNLDDIINYYQYNQKNLTLKKLE